MSNRYFGKVVSIIDEFSLVMNKGLNDDVSVKDQFIVVGLGAVIVDPDTGEELEQLEVVRGKVVVTHVQDKISTLKSCEVTSSPSTREIKKTTRGGGIAVFGIRDGTTETIKPGVDRLKPLDHPVIGDILIAL